MRRRCSVGGALAGAMLGFVVPVGRPARNVGGRRLSAWSIILPEELASRGVAMVGTTTEAAVRRTRRSLRIMVSCRRSVCQDGRL